MLLSGRADHGRSRSMSVKAIRSSRWSLSTDAGLSWEAGAARVMKMRVGGGPSLLELPTPQLRACDASAGECNRGPLQLNLGQPRRHRIPRSDVPTSSFFRGTLIILYRFYQMKEILHQRYHFAAFSCGTTKRKGPTRNRTWTLRIRTSCPNH